MMLWVFMNPFSSQSYHIMWSIRSNIKWTRETYFISEFRVTILEKGVGSLRRQMSHTYFRLIQNILMMYKTWILSPKPLMLDVSVNFAPAHFGLQWRQNGRYSAWNHQPHDFLLNRLFRRRSKKTSKISATGLCAGNSPVTVEFPAQLASNAENASISWLHHGNEKYNENINANCRTLSHIPNTIYNIYIYICAYYICDDFFLFM